MGENLFKGTSPQIESKGMSKIKQKNQVFVEVPNCTTTAVKSTRSYHSDITHSIAFKNKKKKQKEFITIKYIYMYTHTSAFLQALKCELKFPNGISAFKTVSLQS